MVARVEPTPSRPTSSHMRRAHHWVATTLLRSQPPAASSVPAVASWKAWLYTAWVVVATAAYGAYMLRVF